LVEEHRAKRIVFNAPDGLLQQTRTLAKQLEAEHEGLEAIIVADPTYGSCDTVDLEAQRVGADIAFHIGHNVIIQKFGKITYTIDAHDDISFDHVARKAIDGLLQAGVASVGLCTFAQHIREIPKIKQIFDENGIKAVVGKGMGQLHDGQIFGCEFYPGYVIKNEVQAMILLGQSMFHGIGLCLSTGRATYMLDPYFDTVIEVQKVAEDRLKRAILAIYKARDANNLAVIIGLKEGQIMTDESIRIKEKLESLGKSVQLIAMREITADRVNALPDIEAFIQTGCPRISVDGYNFSKPVLSVPQTYALIDLLSGKELDSNFFVGRHWL
jgi:2-(3-amino-3-carboxypropyl)histidine synthase